MRGIDIFSCQTLKNLELSNAWFLGQWLEDVSSGFPPLELRVPCYSDSGKWLSSDGVDIISIYNYLYSVDAIMVLVVAL